MAVVLMIGCQRDPEVYESQRPKTADMQDLNLYERKNEQIGAKTEMTEEDTEVTESTEEVTEETEDTEVTEAETEATEDTEEETEDTEDTETFEGSSTYPQEVYLSGPLNMRDGPGTEYQVEVPLDAGDTVEVIGQVMGAEGPWYRVNYYDESGYVDAEALGLVSDFQE